MNCTYCLCRLEIDRQTCAQARLDFFVEDKFTGLSRLSDVQATLRARDRRSHLSLLPHYDFQNEVTASGLVVDGMVTDSPPLSY